VQRQSGTNTAQKAKRSYGGLPQKQTAVFFIIKELREEGYDGTNKNK